MVGENHVAKFLASAAARSPHHNMGCPWYCQPRIQKFIYRAEHEIRINAKKNMKRGSQSIQNIVCVCLKFVFACQLSHGFKNQRLVPQSKIVHAHGECGSTQFMQRLDQCSSWAQWLAALAAKVIGRGWLQRMVPGRGGLESSCFGGANYSV